VQEAFHDGLRVSVRDGSRSRSRWSHSLTAALSDSMLEERIMCLQFMHGADQSQMLIAGLSFGKRRLSLDTATCRHCKNIVWVIHLGDEDSNVWWSLGVQTVSDNQ
jgi:hypothetical protein